MSGNPLYATVLQQNIRAILETIWSGYYDFNACKSQLDEYIETARKHGLPHSEIDALATLGTLYMTKGQLDEAMAVTQQSYDKSVELNYIKGVDRGLNNMGTIYERSGMYDKALDLFKESLEVTRNSDELRPTIMISYINLVGGLMNLNRSDEAELYLEEAIDMYEHMNERDRKNEDRSLTIGQIYYSKAQLELEQIKYTDALKHARLGHQILASVELSPSYFEAEVILLRCLHHVSPNSHDVQAQIKHTSALIKEFIQNDLALGEVFTRTLDELEYWLTKNDRRMSQYFVDQSKLLFPHSMNPANQGRLRILLDRFSMQHYA